MHAHRRDAVGEQRAFVDERIAERGSRSGSTSGCRTTATWRDGPSTRSPRSRWASTSARTTTRRSPPSYRAARAGRAGADPADVAARPTPPRRRRRSSRRYIAPDMHMRPLGETVEPPRDAGLEVRDVQALREHYVLDRRRVVRHLRGQLGPGRRAGRRGGRPGLAALPRGRRARLRGGPDGRRPDPGRQAGPDGRSGLPLVRAGDDRLATSVPVRWRRLRRRCSRLVARRRPRWSASGASLGQHSVIDVTWGLGFVAIAVTAFVDVGGTGTAARWLLLVLTAVWGVRLAVHIACARAAARARTRATRQLLAKAPGNRNCTRCGRLPAQGVVLWFVSLPGPGGDVRPGPVGRAGLARRAVWVVGFFFESVGDGS